ncbi:MAG: DUF4345 domain-containing protein [Actinobacteria bacterium]|nr:DUF4345 domain-containing protein [Actinomycetota bacterium]
MRRGLQIILALLGVVATVFGLVSVFGGADAVLGSGGASADVDSELRFYAAWYVVAGVLTGGRSAILDGRDRTHRSPRAGRRARGDRPRAGARRPLLRVAGPRAHRRRGGRAAGHAHAGLDAPVAVREGGRAPPLAAPPEGDLDQRPAAGLRPAGPGGLEGPGLRRPRRAE